MAKLEWNKNNKEKLVKSRGHEPIGDLGDTAKKDRARKVQTASLTKAQILESRISHEMHGIKGHTAKIKSFKKEIDQLSKKIIGLTLKVSQEEDRIKIRLEKIKQLKR